MDEKGSGMDISCVGMLDLKGLDTEGGKLGDCKRIFIPCRMSGLCFYTCKVSRQLLSELYDHSFEVLYPTFLEFFP